MKHQLITSVRLVSISNSPDLYDMAILGEVYYMRRTCILKRLVREVLYSVEISLDHCSVDEAKAEARRQLEKFVKQYYSQ